MTVRQSAVAALCARLILLGTAAAGIPMIGLSRAQTQRLTLPLEPRHDSGQSVIGALEGWYQNKDGTYSFLVGYFNRNKLQATDIAVGPNNRIEPGGPDRGQPTHFNPGRGWGLFTITVPKEFGRQTLTWTLTTGGQTTTLPMSLDPLWNVEPFSEIGMGNTPPILSFDEGGPTVQGPNPRSESLTAKAGVPLKLDTWLLDDAKTFPGAKPPSTPAATVTWTKFRGTGEVKFSKDKPEVELTPARASKEHPFAGKATTEVTFSQPGDYILNVTLNDWSGEGGRGFLCCWTNGEVKVSVK